VAITENQLETVTDGGSRAFPFFSKTLTVSRN